MKTWFTSDWHLSHVNIIKYSRRPFTDTKEMNAKIISNFNELVDPDDEVYYLGDLSFRPRDAERFCQEVNGRIKFIIGNHDNRKSIRILKEHCQAVKKYMDISVYKQRISLCHYPLYTHHKSHFNAWSLYGHHHRDISHIVLGKKMNVGVDVNNFKPVSFEQVKGYMEKRDDNWDLIREPRG